MKILLCLTETLDSTVFPRYLADRALLDTTDLPYAINPFDEVALEAAVALKEKGQAQEVVALLIGGTEASLRKAFAFGVDRGIWVQEDRPFPLSFLDRAKIAASFCKEEMPNLILLGKQTIDEDAPQMGQMLAALLKYPFAFSVSSFALGEGVIQTTCEVEDGQDIWSLCLPAILGVDGCLNTPRFLSLMNLIRAKTKPISTHLLSDFSPLFCPNAPKSEGIFNAPKRQTGQIIDNAEALLARLTKANLLPK